ncbi:M48 family metallopeptidase [Bifidobacterium choloepi]|uniref:M48 family metallopeptidase n=1 Tax=Bifidobacterium choloepi TaxID=2614131 RepID=A0A6I5MZC8_9BIFI|nr:SprT family zinc-dependent metalloprotease [Bifidobacterium choloepi]NEG70008.1 M48 family metallopeptidase [Bifidobacterium choloepi]
MAFGNRPSGRFVARRRNTGTPRAVVSRETLDVDGRQVTLVRKNNRNMYLRVKPPYGVVEVTAPVRTARVEIERFVRERADWIDGAQRKMLEARAKASRETEGVTDSFTWNSELKEKATTALDTRLPALLERYRPVVGRSPSAVSYRVMSSRWGSCTPKTGRIRLNLQLGLMDDEFLEYVLVHELTHLWESGHGTGFQRRMDGYLPDWRARRRRLNQHALLEKER